MNFNLLTLNSELYTQNAFAFIEPMTLEFRILNLDFPLKVNPHLVENLHELCIEIYTQVTNLESLGGKVRKK